MKNKIFELYKPESLANFLEFHKSNPNEKFVYVIQQPPPNINILSASDFGYLVICLPNRDQAIFSTAPYVQKMRKNLQDFRKEDYLLAICVCAMSAIMRLVLSKTQGLIYSLNYTLPVVHLHCQQILLSLQTHRCLA